MAMRRPTMRLKRADLPTFGRPTIAMRPGTPTGCRTEGAWERKSCPSFMTMQSDFNARTARCKGARKEAESLRACLRIPFGVPPLGGKTWEPPKGGTPNLRPRIKGGVFRQPLRQNDSALIILQDSVVLCVLASLRQEFLLNCAA